MEGNKASKHVVRFVAAPSPDESAGNGSPYRSCRARLAAPGFPAKALNTGVLTAGQPAHTLSHMSSSSV